MREGTGTGWFIAVIVALALLAISYLVFAANNPHDDSDPANGRSGLNVWTDAKSGCQYVGTAYGITPRMNADGKQICSH